MDSHYNFRRRRDEVKEEKDETQDSTETQDLSETQDISETQSSKKDIENYFKKLLSLWSEFIISFDDSLRKVPESTKEWSIQARKKGKVKCPLQGCSQSFTSVGGLVYHYKRCGIDSKFQWKCKICGFESIKGNRIIIQHLWIDHKDSLPKISSELVEIIENANVGSVVTKSDNRKWIQTFNIVKEFHQKFFNQKVFQNLKPNRIHWNRLNENEYHNYIPQPKTSIHFRSTLSKNSSWLQLNLFESISTEPHLNIHCGGPVWAMAWCPLPMDADHKSDQFLAIASSKNPDISHTLNDTDPEPGLIQIWNVGSLDTKFDASIKPKLALAIAHSCGMIWDMEWCPGGTTFEPITPENQNCDSLPRLGLLAIACGNSFVHIYNIPHPQSLNDSEDYPLYYNEPVMILSPPGVGPSVRNEQTICKCVSWMQSHNQRLIAAGYGSGLVAVWDLTTKSSLLIIKQNANQLLLKPMTSWFAHNAVVNGIKWFPCSEQLLATCSFDRSAKLWNIKDIVAPISVFKKGLFTAIDTHPQWNGMFVSQDDCFFAFQNQIYFKDFGYHNFGSICLMCHKSCVWDLSVSQWTSAIASVDAAGEAAVYPNFKFVAEPRRKTYDKIPLYHLNYVPLDEKSNSKTKKKFKRSDNLIELHNKPPIRTYEEFYDKYGIVFNDFNLREEKDIPIDEINRIRLPTHMQYQRLNDFPLLSINRVCIEKHWNRDDRHLSARSPLPFR